MRDTTSDSVRAVSGVMTAHRAWNFGWDAVGLGVCLVLFLAFL